MTRQQAINAKCKDCIYDTCSPGTWREQVQACTTPDCALYPYRPKSRAGAKRGSDVSAHDASETSVGDEA